MSQHDGHPECAQFTQLLSSALFTEDLAPADQVRLDTHLATCEHCRARQTELQLAQQVLSASYRSVQAPPSLLPKVMAKLPLAVPDAAPAQSGALKVVAVGTRAQSWRIAMLSAIAAAVAVVVGLSFLGNTSSSSPVARGVILDADGKKVSALHTGRTYTVQNEAVVPLHAGATLRLAEGARFAVQEAGGTRGMELQHGDVYTVGSNPQLATSVSMQAFNAELRQGDFFVSSDDQHDARGVLIVFDGLAQVAQSGTPLDVPGGHVFVGVKSHVDAFSEILSIAEVLERLQQDISIQGVHSASLREEYARKVAGYDQELKELAKAANGETDPQKKAELLERRVRVQTYRADHQKRLKSLRGAFPSDQIRRGLDRHLPPDRWM